MSGALPTAPGFSTVSLSSVAATFASTAPSGRRTTRQVGGHLWRLTAQYPEMTAAEFRPISAFVMAQRGRYSSFTVIPPDLATPLGVGGGSPVVNDPALANGGFDADTIWAKDSGWTIAAGVATHASGGLSGLEQFLTLVPGVSYEVTFTITSYTAGTVWPRFPGGTATDGTARSATGTYTETMVAQTGAVSIKVIGDSSFVGSIDDVSIAIVGNALPIDGCPTSTTGWLLAGAVFKLAGHAKVYMLTADADTDGGGAVTLAFEPALMESPGDAEALTIVNVPFTMALRNDVQQYSVRAPMLFTYELDLEEAL